MSYNSDIAAYKLQIDNDISTQSLPNSIPPDVVGSGYTDLADLLAPYINSINNESILSGTGVPSSGTGNNLDLYFRTQSSYFELYRKESGSWVLKVSVPFGITLPDGPATLRSFITGTVASVTKGGWFIANAVYNKATQTNFTVPAADATFYRTDLIYANTSNQILYLSGTPSLTPADPALPANSIAVDYVIVPSVASGFDPYLRYGSTTESNGLAEQNDTGALTYGGITVASGTTVNIGACTGYVVNNESVPGNPTIIYVNYAGETNKTVTTLGSGIATYVLLNGSGVIVFQNTFPTSAQRKTHIYLSKIGHPAGTITTAGNEVDFVLSPLAQHRDLFQAINYINEGVAPSASGATLNFALSTGKITGDGINFVTDNTNPNTYTVAPQPTASFLRRTQTGAGGTFVSLVDVGNYDVAGTITAIPGGANTSTIQYIYLVPTLGLIVQYGQTTYASLTDAIAAVGKESFTIYPSLVRNAILVGALAVIKSATALNNTTQARFFLADKFGQLGGASAGISTATFQSTYDNSLQPQILTDATRGSVQFKRGSAADTDNVFQVLNNAGTANFSVTGNGNTSITGTNAAPSTSGSAANGAVRLLSTGITSTTLDIGVAGTSNYTWLQARSSTDYSVSSDIRLNPNGGGVTIGDTGVATSTIFRVSVNSTSLNSVALIALTNNANLANNRTVSMIQENLVGGGGGQGQYSIRHTNYDGAAGSYNAFRIALNGVSSTTEINGLTTLSLQTGTTTRATFNSSGLFTVNLNQEIKGGAEALKVGTNTGNPDHAYIGLYARTATPTTVSGRIGYTSAAATTLSLVNDISGGGMTFATTGASTMLKQTNAIQLSVTNSSSAEVARISQGTTASTTTSNIYWMQSYLSTHSVGSEIRLNNGGGTLASQTAIASGSALGLIQFGGNTTTAMSSAYNSVAIKAVSTELFSPTAGGSKLELYTTPNTTVAQSLAMSIDQDGSVKGKFKTMTVAPTASDIAAGFFMLVKETTGGTLKLYANDGGTIKSVQLT